MGEQATVRGVRRPLPHLIRTSGELEEVRDGLLKSEAFVIDLETTIPPAGGAHYNEVLWIGLCTQGQVHLIPTGHPKGRVIVPKHKEKDPAFTYYASIGDDDNPKRWTPGTQKLDLHLRKPSWAKVEHDVPATYGHPGEQLSAEAYDILQPLLFSDIPKIGHNVKFDLLSSAKYYGGVIPPGPYHDTIILTHTLNEWFHAYDLKSLVCQWLGVGSHPNIVHGFFSERGGPCNACASHIQPGGGTFIWKSEPKAENEYWCERCAGTTVLDWKQSGGPAKRKEFYPNLGKDIQAYGMDEVARYLAKDVHYDWLYWKLLMRKMEREGLRLGYEFEMDLYPVLMEMERQGFPVDEAIKDAKGDILKAEIAEIEQEVYGIAGDEFPMSHTDTRRYLLFGEGTSFSPAHRKLKTQGLRVIFRTPKDRKPVLTQAVLEYHAIENYLAELFLRWSELEKLRGTFIDGLDQWLVDGKIHTSFKQHGTVTTRLSAHEPNLHQLPRGSAIRDFFVAGKGYKLIVSDYDQVELRVMAELAYDQAMIDIFNEGRDIHREAAAAMLLVAPEDLTDVQRQLGKTVNFSTGYGASEKRVAAIAGVSLNTAAIFIQRYYDNFDRLLPWKEKVLRAARKVGDRKDPNRFPPYVEIPPFGRRRRLPDLYNTEQHWAHYRAERQAINAVVQGFAANITKLAMIDLHYGLAAHPVKMLVQVHDEIVFRCATNAVDEVMPLISEMMQGVTNPVSNRPIWKGFR